MIQGGPDSFIGILHRYSAALNLSIELKAGCFSSDYQKSLKTADELNLDTNRIFKKKHNEEMIKIESSLPTEERLDFISIVTPNSSFTPS